MPQTSYAMMTVTGRAKEAASIASGVPVVLTHIAFGDGATAPNGGETQLYHEVVRKPIVGHGTVVGSANVAYFDAFLAAADGPYSITEGGLIDSAGDLYAIARYDPPVNKPVPASGQVVEGTLRLEVAFTDVAAINITVDPSQKVPLQRLTVLPWIPVLSMTTVNPPGAPVPGDTYLVPAGATGAWAGQAGKIVEYTAAGWAILTPVNGHGISLPDGRIFERIAGVYVEIRATETFKGLVELATTAEMAAGTDGERVPPVAKIATSVQRGEWNYAVGAGTANAILAAFVPAIAAYTEGMPLRVKALLTNTGAVTLNGKPVKSLIGAPLKAGDIEAGMIAEFYYIAAGDCFMYASIPQGIGPYTIGAEYLIAGSTTWNRPSGLRALIVEGVAGGGAGGGSAATTAGNLSNGAGGGAGGWFRRLIIAPAASYVVTIGAGGTGASGAPGNGGTTTSWGAVASATGGGGGGALPSGSGTAAAAGGNGGSGTGGTLTSSGSWGGRSHRFSGSNGFGGDGGLSPFGAGGHGVGVDDYGGAASGYGAGGGGAMSSNGAGARYGGDGSPGVISAMELY